MKMAKHPERENRQRKKDCKKTSLMISPADFLSLLLKDSDFYERG